MSQLYQHINFVDGGILKPNTKPQNNKQQYEFYSKQIVMPVYSPCWQYLIMHTPAVYNWLRTIKLNQDRTNRYLNGEKPFAGIEKDLITKLKQLGLTWDVVQICFLAKFYINKTYNKQCHHLTKRNVNTIDYTYNYPKKQMFLQKYHCINCQQTQVVQATVKRYPMVVMLRRYQDKIYLGKEEYRLYLVIVNQQNNQAFIKIANGAWYSVDSLGIKIRNQAQVKGTKVIDNPHNTNALKIAKPQSVQVKKIIIEQPIKMQVQMQKQQQYQQQQNNIKQYKPKFFHTDLKPLKSNTYTPQTYTDIPLYQKKIKALSNKQKKKDDYDKQYDAGKVKKIKKKKMIHKIDFNKTEKEVKAGNIKVFNKKNKFRKQKHDRQL